VSFPIARIGSAEVFLHVSFVVCALVLGLSGYALHLIVFAGSLMFHEAGHIAAASMLGAEVTRIEVWPFGAVGRLERSWQLTPVSDTMVALAGPFNSGILCSLASALERALAQSPTYAYSRFPLLELLIKVNLGLFVVNLIPCLPLDGGRMLRSQLALRSGYVQASQRMAKWGVVAGTVVTIAAALGVASGIGSYPFLVVGPLIIWGSLDEKEAASVSNIMDILSRSDRLQQRKAIPVQEIMVPQDATVSEVARRFRPSRYHVILVANRSMKVVGKITETRVLEALYLGATGKTMRELLASAKS
jgi:stage IV sporulation protein FB